MIQGSGGETPQPHRSDDPGAPVVWRAAETGPIIGPVAQRQRSRRQEIRAAWADGLTRVAVAAGEHTGTVLTILMFGALEWARQIMPVHLEGASARVANLVLLITEAGTLLKGVIPGLIEVVGDVAETAGHVWHRIRMAWKRDGNSDVSSRV